MKAAAVSNKDVEKIRRKGKRKMGWIFGLAVAAVLSIGSWIGMSFVFREHREIRALPLNLVDFSGLKDGVYTGAYEGGMYGWRANTVEVTVSGSKVTDIRFVSESMPNKDAANRDALYGRVIEQQSLQVDVISGATLTSKGYLQAVENALLQAVN